MVRNFRVKNNKIEKSYFNIYMLLLAVIFEIGSIIAIKFIDVQVIDKYLIIKDINSINFFMGLISIPCCLLYYYMYKNNDFFILTLSYISIWIEYIAINFATEGVFSEKNLLFFPFLFRVILLTIVILNKSKVFMCVATKRTAIFSAMIINIVGLVGEFYIRLNLNLENYIYLLRVLEISIIIYYIFLLICLARRGALKNELIYIIFANSITLFTLRRVVYINFINAELKYIISYNRYMSFIGFSIVFIGLYIEVLRKIKESEKLNNEIVKSEKMISTIKENMKVIKEVDNIRSQFFANISHEFKTPISIIFSCIQLLEIKKKNGDEELAEAYKKYDNTIKQNCYRMLRLINNLVDITKLDSGYMKVDLKNCDIVSLVEEITLSIIPYVENKDISVIFDTFIEELEIRCDPDSIERVMLNLLSNSVKFTNAGGNVLVHMDADDQWVTIRVIDDGIGVKNDIKKDIFERFVQADKSLKREKEGSGIGLALVKSLIELHEGSVCLEQNKESGSEFVVKLPNIRNEEEAMKEDTNIDAHSNPIVEKINIEFSDIYELY